MRDFPGRKMEPFGHQRNNRVRIVDQSRIRDHGRDGHVLRENFIAGVVYRSPFRRNDIPADMFVRRLFSVVLVPYDLEVDQPPGE